MKILVIAALPNELNAIKSGIKSAEIKANINIDYLCSGVGGYESIFILEQYLSQQKEPIFIRNIGICGYWNPNKAQKREPVQIATITNIHSEKELIVPVFINIAPLKNGYSSEKIIFEKPNFNKEIGAFNNEMYFDMESWGIQFVASKFKLPSLILKIPTDFIGSETKSLIQNKNITQNVGLQIYDLLKDLPYNDYLIKILEWIKKQEYKTNDSKK